MASTRVSRPVQDARKAPPDPSGGAFASCRMLSAYHLREPRRRSPLLGFSSAADSFKLASNSKSKAGPSFQRAPARQVSPLSVSATPVYGAGGRAWRPGRRPLRRRGSRRSGPRSPRGWSCRRHWNYVRPDASYPESTGIRCPGAVAMPPPVRSRSNASRPEIGEELLGGWLSGKQSSKVMIAGLVGRVLAAGMCQLARTRIDRWAEGDLANLRTVGLPRLAGILIRQPDQQLGPNRRLADRQVT